MPGVAALAEITGAAPPSFPGAAAGGAPAFGALPAAPGPAVATAPSVPWLNAVSAAIAGSSPSAASGSSASPSPAAPPNGGFTSFGGLARNAAAGTVEAGGDVLNVASDPFGNLIGRPLAMGLLAAHDLLAPYFAGQKFTPAERADLLSDDVPQPGTRAVNTAGTAIGAPTPDQVQPANGIESTVRNLVRFGTAGAMMGAGGGLSGAAAGAASGVGAYAGGEAADTAVPEDSAMRPLAEFLGQIAGGAGIHVAGHAAGVALGTGYDAARDRLGILGIGAKQTFVDPITGQQVSATAAQTAKAARNVTGAAGMTPEQLLASLDAAPQPQTIWRSAGGDFPVEPAGSPLRGPDGTMMQPVRGLGVGVTTNVPADEVVTLPPAAPLPGAPLSMGQQTGNLGLLGRERELRTLNRAPFTAADAQHKVVQQQTLAGLAPVANPAAPGDFLGNVGAALQADRDHLAATDTSPQGVLGAAGAGQPLDYGERMAGLVNQQAAPLLGQAAQAVEQARARVEAIQDQAGGDLTDPLARQQQGAQMQQALGALDNAHRQYVSVLASQIDPGGTLLAPMAAVREAGRRIVGGMLPEEAPMSADEAKLFTAVANVPDALPTARLLALRQRATDLNMQLRGGPLTPPNRAAMERVSQLIRAIDENVLGRAREKATADQAAVAAGTMRPEDTLLAQAARAPEPAAAAPAGAAQPGAAPTAGNTAFTPAGRPIGVDYRVVEARDLVPSHTADMRPNPAFPQALQPRDRARQVSGAQVARIASNLQPERLGASASTVEGAPIVGPDGIVESGNGRVLGIRRAYAQGGEPARRYRAYVAQAAGRDLAGLKEPVLVRVRTTPLSEAERPAVVEEMGRDPTLGMSATETAGVDARRMTPGVVGLWQGGDVDSAANAPFVRAFLSHVAPGAEGRMIGPDGRLSVEGSRRIQNALLMRGYGDADLVARLTETGDENIAAFGRALIDSAGDMARLRAGVEAGAIQAQYDIRNGVLDAARAVGDARRRGVSLADAVGQRDAFTRRDPMAVRILQGAYGDDLRGRISRPRFARYLSDYVAGAEDAAHNPSLFGEVATPEELLEGARQEARQPGGARATGGAPAAGGAAAARPRSAIGGEGARGPAVAAEGEAGRGAGEAAAGGAAAPEVALAASAGVAPPEPPRPNWDAAATERYSAMRAEHRERMATFHGGQGVPNAVGQVLQPAERWGEFRKAASEVAPSLLGTGKAQAERAQAFVRAVGGATDEEAERTFRRRAVDENGVFDPQRLADMMGQRRAALDGAMDYLATDMRAAAERDGRLSGPLYAKWAQKNRTALAAFPDLKARFDTYAKASGILDRLQAAQQAMEDAHPLAGVGSLGKLPPRYVKAGPEGAEAFDRYVRAAGGTAEALHVFDDYALSTLRAAAFKDGQWNPGAAAAWQKRYASLLSRRPDLAARIATTANAQRAIGEAMAQRQRALDAFQKSAAGFFIGREPGKAVDAVLRANDPAAAARQLVTLTRPSRAASEGLKRAFVERLLDRMRDTEEAGTTGVKGTRKNAFQRFFDGQPGAREAYEAVLGPAAMQVVDQVSADMDRQARAVTATKIPGSPGASADTEAIRRGARVPFLALSLAGEVAGRMISHLIGAKGVMDLLSSILGDSGVLAAKSLFSSGFSTVRQLETLMLLDPQGVGRLALQRATPETRRTLAEKLAQRVWQIGGAVGATATGTAQQDQRRAMGW